MTEEELLQQAKDIVSYAIKNSDLPSFVRVSESESGTTILIELFSNKSGTAFVYYNPLNVVVDLLKTQDDRKATGFVSEELHREFTDNFAAAITQLTIENFYFQCSQIFHDAPLLALSIMMEGRQGVLKNYREINTEKNLIDEVLENQKKVFKSFAKQLNHRLPEIKETKKELISYYYNSMHPLWKEIKKCYEDNKHHENWQSIIEIAYQKYLIPQDLIIRLSDIDPYNSMPSTIALEHSARYCGFHDNYFSRRTLQVFLKESKELIKDKTEEEIEKEILLFHKHIVRNIQLVNEVCKLENQPRKNDWEKLIYKIFAEGLEIYEENLSKSENEIEISVNE